MEFVFVFLLICSGLFSGSETALFSIGKVSLARLQQSEKKVHALIARLLEKPRDLLIGVLLGNELTNVALSVVSASIMRNRLEDHTLVEQAMISAAVVVPLLLILGEVTPKTLASKKSEALAGLIARPISAFIKLTRPIIILLHHLTQFIVVRLTGQEAQSNEPSAIDESEFRTLIEVGAQEGVIEEQEHELIQNVLDFTDLTVADVMQPWDRVFSLPERTPLDEAIELISGEPHSRIPVWRGDDRNIQGILLAKDLLAIRWGLRAPRSIKQLRRDPLFTLERRPAAQLLSEFRALRTHMAIVVDEFGKAVGFCTMEDLLEELFGPITDAHPGLEDPDDREVP